MIGRTLTKEVLWLIAEGVRAFTRGAAQLPLAPLIICSHPSFDFINIHHFCSYLTSIIMGSSPSKLANGPQIISPAEAEQIRERLVERLQALQLKHDTTVEKEYVYIGKETRKMFLKLHCLSR